MTDVSAGDSRCFPLQAKHDSPLAARGQEEKMSPIHRTPPGVHLIRRSGPSVIDMMVSVDTIYKILTRQLPELHHQSHTC